jgi:hypothetical protein
LAHVRRRVLLFRHLPALPLVFALLRHLFAVFLPLVLQQLGLAGVLLVAPLAVLGPRRDAPHRLREGGVGETGAVGEVPLPPVAHGQRRPRVVLQDVDLPLRAALVDLVAVLTVVVPRGLQDREVELGDRVGTDVRMPLGEVIDQHAAPLEAHQTRVALVDEAVEVGGLHLRTQLLRWLRGGLLGAGHVVLALLRVHPLAVLLQLVLALELLAAVGAQELSVVGVAQQVHLQLVQSREHLHAVRARVLLVAVERPDVLPDDAVLLEDLDAMGARVHVVLAVFGHVQL